MPPMTALTALRADHPAHTPEAEDVLIECHADAIRFTLDDGVVLDFDASELLSALSPLR